MGGPAAERAAPGLDDLLALRRRDTRDRTGTFLVEGVKHVLTAARHGAIRALAWCPALLDSPIARALVRRARVPCVALSEDAFRRLALAAEPHGIAAVAAARWEPLPAPRSSRPSLVAFESVRSPGNLGTVLRTCAATGFGGAVFLGDGADPHDPLCVRSSMGAIFGLRLHRASHDALGRWARLSRALVIGSSAHASRDYRALAYPRSVVLVMGCEREGMSAAQEALCDRVVRIPMMPGVDSLNLAVATSVLLYEVFNQRHPRPPAR